MKIVIKKDGRQVAFDREKLKSSILNAFQAEEGVVDEYAEAKAENITSYIEDDLKDTITAQELGDLVERGLMSCKKKNVAKRYVLYRYERDKTRSANTTLMRVIKEKIDGSNIVNSNANMDEKSFGGRKGEAANALLKDYALNYCMSAMSRNNHLNNEIYIHKLNCA